MIVVADTSVMLNLCRIRQADLLVRIFNEVIIPPEVAEEFMRLARDAKRFQGLILPEWAKVQSALNIPPAVLAANLDAGETAALALAVQINAAALLVDERRGHQVAVQLGIRTIGVLGILVQAKRLALVPAIRPLLGLLEREARFWISPSVRDRVLREAGESNAEA